MTGYGKAVVAYKEKKINVEVKSLNSKSLDLSTRIAPLYREMEMEIRQMVAKCVVRGKVDFAIWIEKDSGTDATPINAALVENYYRQIKEISAKTGIPEPEDWFYTLLRLPDVMTKTEVEVLDDEEKAVVCQAIDAALQQLVDFRRQEGAALQQRFEQNISCIASLLESIETYESQRVEKIRGRTAVVSATSSPIEWPDSETSVSTSPRVLSWDSADTQSSANWTTVEDLSWTQMDWMDCCYDVVLPENLARTAKYLKVTNVSMAHAREFEVRTLKKGGLIMLVR